MHSSAVLVLALVASAAPALSVPLSTRDTTTAPPSGALNTGLIKDVVSIGNDVISGIQGIKDAVTENQRREFEELFARQTTANLQSGAGSKTDLASDIVTIGNGIISGAQGIKNLFTGKQRREFEALLARQVAADAELVARSSGVDASGALTFPKFINECDVDCLHPQLFSTIAGLQREDMEELLARDTTDSSGALVTSGGLRFNKGISSFPTFLGREDMGELLARDDSLYARSISQDIINWLTKGANIHRREELRARQDDAVDRLLRRGEELAARGPPRAGHRHSTPHAHHRSHAGAARPSRVASGRVRRPASHPAAHPAARSLHELD